MFFYLGILVEREREKKKWQQNNEKKISYTLKNPQHALKLGNMQHQSLNVLHEAHTQMGIYITPWR